MRCLSSRGLGGEESIPLQRLWRRFENTGRSSTLATSKKGRFFQRPACEVQKLGRTLLSSCLPVLFVWGSSRVGFFFGPERTCSPVPLSPVVTMMVGRPRPLQVHSIQLAIHYCYAWPRIQPQAAAGVCADKCRRLEFRIPNSGLWEDKSLPLISRLATLLFFWQRCGFLACSINGNAKRQSLEMFSRSNGTCFLGGGFDRFF